MSDYAADTDLFSGAVKGVSQIAAGDTKDALERANENIASQQAKSEMESGAFNTNLVRLKGAQVTGQQVSAIGANGFQQSGTLSQVVADAGAANERSALTTQNNALRRAWGFQVQGASDAFEGAAAARGGLLSGVGDFIGAGASAWNQYDKDQS